MNKKFEKVEESNSGKFFLDVEYMGGDADTQHFERESIPGVNAYNYMDNWDIIKAELDKYRKLAPWLERDFDEDNIYDKILEEYGEDHYLLSWYENAPQDPQCDFQFKCTLAGVDLIYYDEQGNKYRCYTNV